MQLLLESHERQWLSLGATVSIVIHAMLLGLILLAYREAPPRKSFSDQLIAYLVPPDRDELAQGTATRVMFNPSAGNAGSVEQQPVAGGTGARIAGKPDTTMVPSPPRDPIAELLSQPSVLTEIEVDSTVRRYPESAAPAYPEALLKQNLEGSVFAVYVVDSTGLVDTSTFRVIQASHPGFVTAVKEALPGMRFRPAMVGGLAVRQLVQQSFSFKITHPDSSPGKTKPKPPPPPGSR